MLTTHYLFLTGPQIPALIVLDPSPWSLKNIEVDSFNFHNLQTELNILHNNNLSQASIQFQMPK